MGLWVLVAVVLMVARMVSRRRSLATLALAALPAAAGAELGSMAVGAVVFALAAAVLLTHRRRSARRRMRRARERARRDRLAAMREGPSALVGRDAVVLERIVNGQGLGIVNVGGHVFNARALHDDEVIDAGEQVEVVDVRGATALVA
jgi:membrane protein implicated in regulation of membrane protease activity